MMVACSSLHSRTGFALLEVLLALSLFVLSVAGATTLQLQSLRASEDAGRSLRAAMLALDYLQRAAIAAGLPAVVGEATDASVLASCRGAGPCTEYELATLLEAEWRLQLDSGPAAGERAALPAASHCGVAVAGGTAVTLRWPRRAVVSAPATGAGCGAPASAQWNAAHWWSYRGNRP